MNVALYSRTLGYALSGLLLATECLADDSPKTVVRDQAAAEKLGGDHFFALQWISWDHYGRVSVTTNQGVWEIKGRQDSRETDDFITIEGVITEVNKLDFGFSGTIITKVSHVNEGRPTTRSGAMTFRISGKRQYWRLKEMQNPASGVTDYIDVFFKKYEKPSRVQDGPANGSQPIRSETNSTSSAAGSRR